MYTVDVKQRGRRKRRQAQVTLGYQSITFPKPSRAVGLKELQVNVIICQEKESAQDNPLCWILYTSEPINTAEDAQQLVRYYELRWRIEEFHKVWKSDGTEVEALRLQRCENIKRIAVIKAFITVRLMQLQTLVQNNQVMKEISCTTYATKLTWQLLWGKV